MPSIEEEIITWLNTRPLWTCHLAARLLRDGAISEDELRSLASDLIANTLQPLEQPLSLSDTPGGAVGGAEQVRLISVGPVSNVNALLGEQVLRFGTQGLTLIYGDNASGKSGYARLIKEVTGARHRERILPNAFDPSSGNRTQSAIIKYLVNDEVQTLEWPAPGSLELSAVHFYDEACGNDYLATDTEVTYRPSILNIFDKLIAATDALRRILDEELQKVSTPIALPELDVDTEAAQFLAQLTAKTTQEDIDRACTIAPDSEEKSGTISQELARLQASNPAKERQQLTQLAKAFNSLADHFENITDTIGKGTAAKLLAQYQETVDLRRAADLASSRDFSEEPLKGVGSASWRALWAAAQEYAQSEAYRGREYPAIDGGDRCVLCQQVLDDDSRDRLDRFHLFIQDHTEQRARTADRLLQSAVTAVRDLSVLPVGVSSNLALLQGENETLRDELQAVLESAEAAKSQLLNMLAGEDVEEIFSLKAADIPRLRVTAQQLEEQAQQVDDTAYRAQIKQLEHDRRELRSRLTLSAVRANISAEVARREMAQTVSHARAAVSTAQITTKSADMTRTFVTSLVGDHFIRECEHLRLAKIGLTDRGGVKGKLRQRPGLIGVNSDTEPKSVLSEGEQTALGLAGLFTEIHFDESKSAVVLDDPVSSLSHARRRDVAERVVEIAKERQVIVLTHDLTFLGYLVKAADTQKSVTAERCIERTPQQEPGRIRDEHPWKSKDAKKRLAKLKLDIERIERDQKDLDGDSYRARTAEWAGELSETYERIVRSQVANQLVDGATTEVRPRMFRLLAKITEDDNTDFQTGYGIVSEWAARHDKSEAVNAVSPSVEQMRQEWERANAWFLRIKSYAD